MSTPLPSTTFETTLSGTGSTTGIVVPPEAVEALGAGRRPPVLVDVNGHTYRSTVGVMGGQHLVPVSAAIRAETRLVAGDALRVTLTLAPEPREVDVPADLAAALTADEQAGAFFATLSNSLQRYHVDTVTSAKTAETRQRRIDRAVSLLHDGKKR